MRQTCACLFERNCRAEPARVRPAVGEAAGDGCRRASASDAEAAQKQRAAGLEEAVFAQKAQALAGAGNVLLFEPAMNPDSLRRLTDLVMSACGGRAAVFAGSDADGYKYAVGEQDGDLRQLVKELNAQLHGRGGGKPFFAQGSVQAGRAEIEVFFAGR